MFPAAFDYRAPTSLDETLSVLKQHGEAAKVMAGGQSLIPLLKLRFSRPELVVDIARLVSSGCRIPPVPGAPSSAMSTSPAARSWRRRRR